MKTPRILGLYVAVAMLPVLAWGGNRVEIAKKNQPTKIELHRNSAGDNTAAPLIVVEGDDDLPGPLRVKKYFYSSFGSRDPFRSLLAGPFEPKVQELLDLRTVRLVGVLWEPDEHIAMVQDGQGFGYILRPGDRVRNGNIVSVSEEALVARLHVFGQTTRVTLRLQREE